MESESGISHMKISDSGYSNSCSNTNSQRSASSKSRHSGSNSSRSSGYCGATNADGSVDIGPQPPKRNKEKEHKKKKLKSIGSSVVLTSSVASPAATATENKSAVNAATVILKEPTPDQNMGVEVLPTTTLEIAAPAVEATKALPEAVLAISPTLPVTADIPRSEEVLPSWNEESRTEAVSADRPVQPKDTIAEPIKTTPSHSQDGFCCVISMYDGVVLYTTPSLTTVLGFPKDMWLGRSFIDFVHPKDRETFSSQVTTGVALPLVDSQSDYKDYKNCLYVCLRKYRGLRSSGFGVLEKAVAYQAFKLTVKFKHITDAPESKLLENNSGMFLVVVAVPVYTSYKVPDERRKSPKFGMQHTAAGVFSHVDPDVVTNFGFLPQDMLGKSVFDFYHPDDKPLLKEIYESVMRMCQVAGSVFRSKPYRFAVQNGGFALVETEWSSFINPWSRRLEFVIGSHRVLQGPANPDIFDSYTEAETKNISEEALNESKIIEGEILLLLNEEFSRPSESSKYVRSKRCIDLANFMESLMDEVSKSNLELDLPQELDPTISERGSVMLGEISPHHDYYDSVSSSETPPSYNQLNYNENIQRFFESKPKTTVSDESNGASHINADTEQEGKPRQDCTNNQKCLSPVENGEVCGSGSAGNLSCVSNPNIESGITSGTNTSNGSGKPVHLTESLLFRHNEDMEKIMIKKHREQRSTNKDRDSKKAHRKLEMMSGVNRNNFDNNEQILAGYTHGLKRSGTCSRDGDNHKVSKHRHQTSTNQKYDLGPNNVNGFHSSAKLVTAQNRSGVENACAENIYQTGLNDVNLWPPFSVSVTPMSNNHVCSAPAAPVIDGGLSTGVYPVYYIPTAHQRTIPGQFNDPVTSRYPVQYMPGMVYNYNSALYPAAPIICPTLPILPVPMVSPIAPMTCDIRTTNTLQVNSALTNVSIHQTEHKPNPGQSQGPASHSTAVTAEPGRATGSVSSPGVANKALESSRKDLGLQSVCSPASPLVSSLCGDTEMELFIQNPSKVNETVAVTADSFQYCKNNNQTQDEESSCYSSSYSSFLKTDTGSGSNDESNMMDLNKSDDDAWKSRYPMRKKDPPWLDSVSVSPDLIYRYQMTVKDLEDILRADLNILKTINQPVLVNDQLNQLYTDMELEGLSKKLTLEEGITSSSSSDDNAGNILKPKKKRKSFSSLVMIYEENAPFPPPQDN